MIVCAVIDTNVLVSALISRNDDAATVQVVEKVLIGEIVPLYSPTIIKEYRDVLNRSRFGFSGTLTDYLITAIEKIGIQIDPSQSGASLPDMKDMPFYEVVLEKQNDNAFLVTGNIRHFLKEPFIVTPSEMLKILDKFAKNSCLGN